MSRFLLLNFKDFGLSQDITQTIQSQTLVCVCCLDSNLPLINLSTCKHEYYLESFYKTVFEPSKKVVCSSCHNMLKKIEDFRQQVLKSFSYIEAEDTNYTQSHKLNLTAKNVVSIFLPPAKYVPERPPLTNLAEPQIKKTSVKNEPESVEPRLPVVKIKEEPGDTEDMRVEIEIEPVGPVISPGLSPPSLLDCEITFEEYPEDTTNNDNEYYDKPFEETSDEIWIPVPNQLTEAGDDGVCGEALGDDTAEASLKLLNRKNYMDETQECPCKIPVHHADNTPEYSHIHPEEPTCSKNLGQLFKHRSGFVKLEIIPMDNQLSSNTCPVTFNSNPNHRHVNRKDQQAMSDDSQTQMAGQPYICNTCNEQFCCPSDLIRHIKIHTDEKTFSCDTCDKEFSEESTLITHLQTHTAEKPFSCNICHMKFSLDSILITHLQRHINEKQFVSAALEQQSCLLKLKQNSLRCDICGKQFSYLSKLKRHILIHTGEKPFPCDMCDKQFNQKASLIKHSRKHLGKKQLISAPLAQQLGQPEEKSVRCDT